MPLGYLHFSSFWLSTEGRNLNECNILSIKPKGALASLVKTLCKPSEVSEEKKEWCIRVVSAEEILWIRYTAPNEGWLRKRLLVKWSEFHWWRKRKSYFSWVKLTSWHHLFLKRYLIVNGMGKRTFESTLDRTLWWKKETMKIW